MNRAVLACIEELCRRIMGNNVPFGGKSFALGGDFTQTSPIVRYGSRAQVVDASIRSSPLWPLFNIFRLVTPIRNAEDRELSDFLDQIGDGAGPEVDLSPFFRSTASMDEIIDFVYPPHILNHPLSCLSRNILAVTNAQIDRYNVTLLNQIDGVSKTYYAADSLNEVEDVGLAPPQAILDYAARHTPSGFPPMALTIKVNAVYRLLRNFSQDRRLVKNTRVLISALSDRLVTVRKLLDEHDQPVQNPDDGEAILIPRIIFTTVLPSSYTLTRRQFPLAPAYATTFNGCTGLTLDKLGVDLTKPAFSHGQLYTALTRVQRREHALLRMPANVTRTANVTYHELLL
jgi:ATP-dependent DNA helicase PIF1